MKLLVTYVLLGCALCDTVKLEKYPNTTEDIVSYTASEKIYLPNWKDLDSRPLPYWYDSAKIGIFIHWGIYSDAGQSEWLWRKMVDGHEETTSFIKQNYGDQFKYEDLTQFFKPNSFNPDKWAKLFAKSGAKYVVLTAKHHDGFALFPTNRQRWNSIDVGPKKDIVKLLSEAVRKQNIRFGVYYSLYEWYHPLFVSEKEAGYNTTQYTDYVVRPDIEFLINNYEPSVLWSDGESDANYTYWKSPELLAWLYNESPVKNEIVVNDRWGAGTNCYHGDFFNCEDRYNPRDYAVIRHKWENAISLDKYSWGYRSNMKDHDDVLSDEELLETIVSTVSCAGNVLINIGPTSKGTIPTIFRKRLLRLGKWLETNGEAIYGTSPWYHHRDELNADVWYTCKKKEYHATRPVDMPMNSDTVLAIYAIFLKWPDDYTLRLRDLNSYFKNNKYFIEILRPKGFSKLEVNCLILNDTVVFDLPVILKTKMSSGVLKITKTDT